MDRIPRTGDDVLDALIRRIERYHGTKIAQGEVNQYVIAPCLHYLALTCMEYTVSNVEAEFGAVIDDTLTNPRFPYRDVYCDARVGTEKGQGICHSHFSIPEKKGIRALERKIDFSLNEALVGAADSYDEFVSESRRNKSGFVPNMIMVKPVRSLDKKIKKNLIPIDKLRSIACKCSKILSQNHNQGKVQIEVHEDTRWMANSEGTVIKDKFFGYSFFFEVQTRDNKNGPISFTERMYLCEENVNAREHDIINFARWIFKEVEKNKNSDQILKDGLYPVLLYPAAMATPLHECFVHFLSSEEILYNESSAWGWENFGELCTNPHLSVYASPGMPGKWGSMNFDYEGIPAQRRILIEKGKVKGYLADRNGAYHLSKLTGSKILPGDSRIGYPREGDDPESAPRISNLELEYGGSNVAKSRKELEQRFVEHLRKNNLKKGILIPTSSGGCCYTEEGLFEAYFDFAYVVDADGKHTPTRKVLMRSDVFTFLKNIVEMGGRSEYVAHRCGLSDSSTVRAGLACSAGVVKDVYIKTERTEELRQKPLKF